LIPILAWLVEAATILYATAASPTHQVGATAKTRSRASGGAPQPVGAARGAAAQGPPLDPARSPGRRRRWPQHGAVFPVLLSAPPLHRAGGGDVAFVVIVVVGGAAAARVVLAASDGEDGCHATVSAQHL
jgi:hypothetical protein